MADLPSRDDFRRVFEVAVLNPPPGNVRPRITRAALETAGTDANALREGAAAVGDEISSTLTFLVAGWYPDSAEGAQLDRRVLDYVGLARKDAAVSLCSTQWSLTTPLVFDLVIPKETVVSTPDGIEYLTTVEALLPKATVGPLTIPVRSKRADSGVLAIAGSITAIKTTIPNAPSDLTVTNQFAASVGDDAEDDRSLLAAYKNFWTTAVKGTLASIQQAALRVPGVVSATALEFYDNLGRQTKQVLLAVSDKFTEQYVVQNQVPPAYQTRSQQLSQEVSSALLDTRCAGVYVGVFVAKVTLLSVQLQLTFTAGADPFAVAEHARSTAANYVNNLAPGAAFRRKDCANALRFVPGLVITGNEVAYPPGDVVPKALEKLGTSLSGVTANGSAVDRPLPLVYGVDAYLTTTET